MKKYHIILAFMWLTTALIAQKKQQSMEEAALEATRFVANGNDYLVNDKNFPAAEGEYRKAIAKNPIDETATYNLGNAYYFTQNYDEALQRFDQTAKVTKNKDIKQRAYHNEGNTFMRQKKYKEAVAAYKNALRNNPTDNETRYNLALAKKMLEQQENENKDNKNENKDDKKENKDDKKEGDKKKEDKNKEGDKKDKDKDKEGDKEDKEKEGDKKDKDEEKEDEGKKDKKDEKGKPDEEEKEDRKDGSGDKSEEKKQPPRAQGQLSPQQVKSLLEAMSKQEKQVQEKMNSEKIKGAKVKSDKDW